VSWCDHRQVSVWADADQAPADWPYPEQLARWTPAPPRTLDLGRRVRLALIARAEQAMSGSREGAPPPVLPPRAVVPTVPAPTAREAGMRPTRRRGRRAAPEAGPVLSFLDPAGGEAAPVPGAGRPQIATVTRDLPASAAAASEQEGVEPDREG